MPGLTFIKILGNLKFFSHGLKLGTEWKSSFSIKDESAFHPEDKQAAPQLIPPWFMPAEGPNKYHQEGYDRSGKEIKELTETLLDAVRYDKTVGNVQP